MFLFASQAPSDNDSAPFEDFSLPSTDFGAAFLKMLLTLAAIVALLFLTYWLLKKLLHYRGARGAELRKIHVLEKRLISPKTALYLVEVEGEKILLAESHLEVEEIKEFQKKLPCSRESP